jgi:hypothetical protein
LQCQTTIDKGSKESCCPIVDLHLVVAMAER